MTKTAHTPGNWDFACDSYGKVRHSKKACIYSNVTEPGGDRLVTVAARVENWDDARLMAASKEMYAALKLALDKLCLPINRDGSEAAIAAVREAIAKAEG